MKRSNIHSKCAKNLPVRLKDIVAANDCGELLVRPMDFADFILDQAYASFQKVSEPKICLSKGLNGLLEKRIRRFCVAQGIDFQKFQAEIRAMVLNVQSQ